MNQTMRLLTAAGAVGLTTFGVHSLAEQSIREDMEAACVPVEVSVYFAPSQTELNEFAEDLLDQAVSQIEHCQLAQIDVTGFADHSGQAEYNYRVSEMRAHAALEFLEERGVTANMINLTARGEEGALQENGEPVVMRRKADLRFIPSPPNA